ncbi:ACP S-malonyltransferase [Anaerolineae bacterium CFX9]|jgi:[acyl-carrier-protein] S-malonyltransferase|nr:ACP S-malonyltransferase [Anaerolineae bacterium CFX9]
MAVDWSRSAFVFPGQGSQVVGMAKDLAAAYPAARAAFDEADDILGFRLSALCFEGPQAELDQTLNTQPALFVAGIAALRALEAELGDVAPLAMAGHSLGEFTALSAAGALSFADGVRLVRERGRLMTEAGERSPGAMAALLGLDAEPVREICAEARRQTGGTVVLANDNCPGQIVISGEHEPLDAALELAKAAGARRAVKLAVSIAAHSPLMAPAAESFRAALDQTAFQTPRVPVYANTSATPITTPDAIRAELEGQLTQSVRWTESVQAMIAAGVDEIFEFGSKDVLVGLMKRIDGTKNAAAVNSLESLTAVVNRARG